MLIGIAVLALLIVGGLVFGLHDLVTCPRRRARYAAEKRAMDAFEDAPIPDLHAVATYDGWSGPLSADAVDKDSVGRIGYLTAALHRSKDEYDGSSSHSEEAHRLLHLYGGVSGSVPFVLGNAVVIRDTSEFSSAYRGPIAPGVRQRAAFCALTLPGYLPVKVIIMPRKSGRVRSRDRVSGVPAFDEAYEVFDVVRVAPQLLRSGLAAYLGARTDWAVCLVNARFVVVRKDPLVSGADAREFLDQARTAASLLPEVPTTDQVKQAVVEGFLRRFGEQGDQPPN